MGKAEDSIGFEKVFSREPDPVTIYTVGHADLAPERLLALLRRHGIERVVDVRTTPRAAKAPQFDREKLSPFLRIRRIKYLHLEALGGLRRHVKPDSPNTGWRNASLRGFADYMLTPQFAVALAKLIGLGRARSTALFCTEASPWRCHRMLIADALVVRGIQVVHLLSPGREVRHELSPQARVAGTVITYPATPAG